MRKTEYMMHRRVVRRLRWRGMRLKDLMGIYGVAMHTITYWTAIDRVTFCASGVIVPAQCW